MSWLPYLWIPLGYFIGATPFGYLAGKLKGIDLRDHGSKNIGATNAVRVLGKPVGLTVFGLDVVKGALPVFLARIFAWDIDVPSLIPVLTAIVTIIGHNFTFWLGFKGGKGIATSAGAMLPLMPLTLLVAIIVWIVLFLTTRYVSVGSIFCAASLPISQLVFQLIDGKWQIPLLLLALAVAVSAILRHKVNIERLREGTESKFVKKKDRPSENDTKTTTTEATS